MKQIKQYAIFSLALGAVFLGSAGATHAAAVNISVGGGNGSPAVSVQASNQPGQSGVNVSVGGGSQPSMGVSIDGSSARSMSDFSTSIAASSDVQSSADLNAYAEAMARNDSSISAVNSDSQTVSVTFKKPAKLLGFIPVSLNENAEVSVDGNGEPVVSVTKPWWSVFASGDSWSDTLASDIKSNLSTNDSAGMSASLSSSQQAAILDVISQSSTSASANVGK